MSTNIYPTLEIVKEGYLLHKSASGRSEYTLRNIRIQLTRHNKYFGNNRVSDVTSADLDDFFNFLRNEYTPRSFSKSKRLAPKTLRNAWSIIRAFWNWASVEFGIDNPFKVDPIKAHSKPIRPLSRAEIDRILETCEYSATASTKIRSGYRYKRGTYRRDKAIILLFVDTGIRVSELCNANLCDLALENGRLLVNGKGNKQRYVYFGRVAGKALWAYISQRYPDNKPDQLEPLFVQRDGFHRVNRHSIRLLLRRLGEKAGVDNVHPHRFRHTFAIEFIRNGGDVFTLQQLLGHSSLEMVKRYLQLAQVDFERIHRKASPADNWRL